MKCPHCTVHFHDNWSEKFFERYHGSLPAHVDDAYWCYRTASCPRCGKITIEMACCHWNGQKHFPVEDWRQVYPIGANRGPVPPEVPKPIAEDYIEACNVLPISAKASAALARDLAREIDLLLAETDPKRALPLKLRVTVDGIRHFGNFSAHPIDDKTTLQVIDVELHEAEWCLEIIEDMFEHFYVAPARCAQYQRYC
jgi:hypothetical protein